MMNQEKWEGYLKAFAEDYEKAIHTYYAPDVIFETPKNKFSNTQELLDYFNSTRKGIREVLIPLNVFVKEGGLAAELNAELQAYDDAPDFPEKPLKKGESISKRVCAFYDFRDEKISRVKIYHS